MLTAGMQLTKDILNAAFMSKTYDNSIAGNITITKSSPTIKLINTTDNKYIQITCYSSLARIESDASIYVNNELQVKDTITLTSTTSTIKSSVAGATINIGASGNTVNLNVSGVTYNLPSISRHSDVNISSPSDKQVLYYNASTSKWTHKTLSYDMTDFANQDLRTTASPTFTKLTLSQSTGTAPLTITSTTKVSNLNADMVDDKHVWDIGISSGGIPVIKSDGVMEISRYIDFHHSNTDSQDYAARLHTDGTNNGELFINSNKIWHAGNDGSGSGLDADTVDTYHLDQDVRTTASPTFVRLTLSQTIGTAPLTVSSTTLVSNLNSDMVDEYHANTGTAANTIPVRDSSGNIPGNITGNAATATKLQTARTISLSGDVTGSASFDGSSDITINTTVVDNSHNHSNYLPLSGGTMTGTLTIKKDGNVISLQPVTSGGNTSVIFNSKVNSGSDKGFILWQDDSAFVSAGAGNENARLVVGVYNDFTTGSTSADELWLQGGSRLVINTGSWDSELNSIIGTPAGSATTCVEFRQNNTKIAEIKDTGISIGQELTIKDKYKLAYNSSENSLDIVFLG